MHAEDWSNTVVLQVPSSSFSHDYRKVDRLSSLSRAVHVRVFCLSLVFLFHGSCLNLAAQATNAGRQELLHGSIFTAQGQPASEAAVELRNLKGIKVASAVTDSAGNFEIESAAELGEYVFLVASGYQIRYEQVLLAQPGLELSLALPATAVSQAPAAARYIISAEQLGVPAKARERLAAAQEWFRKFEFVKAEQAIDGALRADPAFAQAFTVRAFIRLAQKNANAAIEDARRAAELDAYDAESFVALAMSYNSLGQFREAEEAAWHALSLRPDSWQARLELAKTFYGQGRWVVALREMDDLRQDFPDVHLVRANVLEHLNRAEEAAGEFDRFLQQAPQDPRSEQIRKIVARVTGVERSSAVGR